MTPLVDLIVGTRPNFVKAAAIVRALEGASEAQSVALRLVHTGQHYDPSLSGDFFSQLGIPEPDVNLGVGSATQAVQTARIMTRYESLIGDQGIPHATIVLGDVNSTMACAITAQKMGIPVGHVEAGIRSGDWSMPEEINRLVTDAVSNWYFTTSEYANTELRRCGVDATRIYFVGNTMIDTLLANRPRFYVPGPFKSTPPKHRGFLVVTLHRPSNVDDPSRLQAVIEAIEEGVRSSGVVAIFPMHPRTSGIISEYGISIPPSFRCCGPLPYLEFGFLVDNAMGVITDSGGVTEEATALEVPCVTLRDSTERPETVVYGTNELIGTDPAAIQPALRRMLGGNWKRGRMPPLWDGCAGVRIAHHLHEILNTRRSVKQPRV